LQGARPSGARLSGGRFGPRPDAIPLGGGFLRRAAVHFAAVPTEGAVAVYQQCDRTRPRDHQGGAGPPTADEPPAVMPGPPLRSGRADPPDGPCCNEHHGTEYRGCDAALVLYPFGSFAEGHGLDGAHPAPGPFVLV